MDKHICLNIGHGVRITPQGARIFDPGAVQNGLREWDVTEKFAFDLVEALKPNLRQITVELPKEAPLSHFTKCFESVFLAPKALSVSVVATDWGALPALINKYKPNACISFHANSFTAPTATGSEVLYWGASQRGKELAVKAADANATLGLARRQFGGTVPINSKQARGALILHSTKCPTVINEPFFLSNPNDIAAYNRHYAAYVQAWAQLILSL